MNGKIKLLFLIVSSLFVLTVILVSLWIIGLYQNEYFILNAIVVYPLDHAPVTNIVAEVVDVNGHVVAQQMTDSMGQVTFKLGAGQYVVQIASGYTGQVSINLQSNQSIRLDVLPVLR